MSQPIDTRRQEPETDPVSSSKPKLPLSHLAGILKAQRDEARRRLAERDQALVALHQSCQRYKAELSVLRRLKEEIDDDSEARTEQLAALQLALSQAQEMAAQSEARAARYAAELERTRQELLHCQDESAELAPTSSNPNP